MEFQRHTRVHQHTNKLVRIIGLAYTILQGIDSVCDGQRPRSHSDGQYPDGVGVIRVQVADGVAGTSRWCLIR